MHSIPLRRTTSSAQSVPWAKSVYRAGVRVACNPSPSVNEADDSVQSISKCGGTDDLQPILTSIRPKTKGSTFRHGFSIYFSLLSLHLVSTLSRDSKSQPNKNSLDVPTPRRFQMATRVIGLGLGLDLPSVDHAEAKVVYAFPSSNSRLT